MGSSPTWVTVFVQVLVGPDAVALLRAAVAERSEVAQAGSSPPRRSRATLLEYRRRYRAPKCPWGGGSFVILEDDVALAVRDRLEAEGWRIVRAPAGA